MINITDPSKCCGCTACAAVCPHDAIVMKGDALGFPYPHVDENRCVECGLCEKVCAFVPDVAGHVMVPDDIKVEAKAVRHKDAGVVSASQSGGAFTALSDLILNERGVVYGAAFDDEHMVRHIRVSSADERAELRGSKYVQSDLDGIFRDVKADLKAGVRVLFAGTPCQVAGLKSYIPESLQENLVLVDFICHGVPSPAVWKDYVAYMSRRGRVVKAYFRDKSEGGWKIHKESFVYENGKKRTRETYRILFYKNIMLRHSCAVCPYDVASHKADVTLADFWGVDEAAPSMDGDAGTSMVICNTARGRELFDRAEESMRAQQAVLDYSFMSRRNPNLVRPARIDKDRMCFEREYAAKGFLHVARRWSDLGLRYRLWQLKRFILGKK